MRPGGKQIVAALKKKFVFWFVLHKNQAMAQAWQGKTWTRAPGAA